MKVRDESDPIPGSDKEVEKCDDDAMSMTMALVMAMAMDSWSMLRTEMQQYIAMFRLGEIYTHLCIFL